MSKKRKQRPNFLTGSMTKGRKYLDVPFSETDTAKLLGAQYDMMAHRWFAPDGTDWNSFSRWHWDRKSLEQRQAEALKKFDAKNAWPWPKSKTPLELEIFSEDA